MFTWMYEYIPSYLIWIMYTHILKMYTYIYICMYIYMTDSTNMLCCMYANSDIPWWHDYIMSYDSFITWGMTPSLQISSILWVFQVCLLFRQRCHLLKDDNFFFLQWQRQRTATHCNTLQYTATHCNTLQRTATHCNTLQHTATHCNTLKITQYQRQQLRTRLQQVVGGVCCSVFRSAASVSHVY